MVVGALKKDDRCWKVGDFGNTVGKKVFPVFAFLVTTDKFIHLGAAGDDI